MNFLRFFFLFLFGMGLTGDSILFAKKRKPSEEQSEFYSKRGKSQTPAEESDQPDDNKYVRFYQKFAHLFKEFEEQEAKMADDQAGSDHDEKVELVDSEEELQSAIKDGKVYLLSDIISSYLAHSKNKFLHSIKNQFKAQELNEIRDLMAKKWARNASTRIFYDHRRSFLELVVNACDAMLPTAQSVGKFGMGFFSIFSFLSHEERVNGQLVPLNPEIQIDTTYQTKNEDFYAYRMIFKRSEKVSGDIEVTFQSQEVVFEQATTTIRIIPTSGVFSSETLRKIENYVHYLDFFPHAQVSIIAAYSRAQKGDEKIEEKETLREEFSGNPEAKLAIGVILKSDEIRVVDDGSGISLKTAFSSLLIPSSSTKKGGAAQLNEKRNRALQELKDIKNPVKFVIFKGKDDEAHSHFLIEINGVVVVNRKLQKPVHDARGKIVDLLISLPQVTQLTLARDEVSFAPDSQSVEGKELMPLQSQQNKGSFEEKYIKAIITKVLEEHLLADEHVSDPLLLTSLYQGLVEWEEQSAAQQIKGVFTDYFKHELERIFAEHESLIPAPKAFYGNLKGIVQDQKTAEPFLLVPLDDELVHHNFMKLEAWLKELFAKRSPAESRQAKALAGKFIKGYAVFFVDEKHLPHTSQGHCQVSSLGLRTSLFVPHNFVRQQDIKAPQEAEGKFAIEEKYAREKKVSVDDEPDQKDSVSVEQIASRFPERDLQPYQESKDAKTETPLDIIVTTRQLASSSPDVYPSYEEVSGIRNHILRDFSLFTERDRKVLREFWKKNSSFLMQKGVLQNVRRRDGKGCSTSTMINGIWVHEPLSFWDDNERPLISLEVLAKGIGSYVNEVHSHSLSYSSFFNELLSPCWIKGSFIVDDEGDNCWYLLNRFNNSEEKLFNEQIARPAQELALKGDFKELERFLCQKFNEFKVIFKPVSLEQVMNFLFGNLLKMYGFESYQQAQDNLFFGSQKLFPLPEENKLNHIETIFFKLLWQAHCLYPINFYIEPYSPINLEPFAPHKTTWLLELPGADQKQVGQIMREGNIGLDFSWAQSINAMLTQSCDNFSMNAPINSIASWHVLQQLPAYDSVLTGRNKLLLMKLKETLLGLYNKYFSIPDDEFKRVYGDYKKIKTLIPSSDVTPDQLNRLLLTLQKKQPLFEKMLDFQVTDFGFQIRADLRADDIAHKFLYMPSALSNTPLSLLALLLSKGVSEDIVFLLAEHTRSPKELIFMVSILLQGKVLALIQDRGTNYSSKKAQIDNTLIMLITRFLREKIDQERITDVYTKNRTKKNFSERSKLYAAELATQVVFETLQAARQERTAFREVKQFLTHAGINKQLADAKTFSLTQLMQAHTNRQGIQELLRKGELDGIRAAVLSQSGDLDIGKITQDIEAGSEKNPFEGSLVEALQNSIDAVKAFSKAAFNEEKYGDALVKYAQRSYAARLKEGLFNKPTIASETQGSSGLWSMLGKVASYPVGLVKKVTGWNKDKETKETLATVRYTLESLVTDQDRRQICLTMRDYAGMPSLETLLTDFILPDFSRKSPKLGNIGDMGNGSFNMYRFAERVCVMTRTLVDDKIYLLAIQPVRNEDGLVVNLNLKAEEVTKLVPAGFFGTSIKILFKPQPANQVAIDLAALKDFMLTCVGATQVDVPVGKNESVKIRAVLENPDGSMLLLNKDQVTPQTLLYEHRDEKGQVLYKIYERSNPLLQSYMTTGGVPFRSLTACARSMELIPTPLLSMLSSGYVLDLGLGTYEPVQSRTQVQMQAPLKRVLKESLLEALYIAGLRMGAKDAIFFQTHITHFASSVDDFAQVSLSQQDNDRAQKIFSDFVQSTSGNNSFLISDFFEFYRTKSLKKSFYDHHVENYKAIAEPLRKVYKEISQAQDTHIARWIDEKKASIEREFKSLEERWTFIAQLRKEYGDTIKPFSDQWEAKKNELFGAWKGTMLETARRDQKYPALFVENERYGLVKDVVIPWFSKKIERWYLGAPVFPFDKQFKNTAQGEKEWDSLYDVKEWLEQRAAKDLHGMLKSYCVQFVERVGRPYFLKEARFVYDKKQSIGWYDPADQSLNINLVHCDVSALVKMLCLIAKNNKQVLLANKGYLDLFAPKVGYTPVVVHELEHARRNSSHHGEGVHTSGEGASGDRVGYDACANSYAKLALQNGLIDAWVEQVRKECPLQDGLVRCLDGYYFEKLREIEREDKDFLMKKMGFIK